MGFLAHNSRPRTHTRIQSVQAESELKCTYRHSPLPATILIWNSKNLEDNIDRLSKNHRSSIYDHIVFRYIDYQLRVSIPKVGRNEVEDQQSHRSQLYLCPSSSRKVSYIFSTSLVLTNCEVNCDYRNYASYLLNFCKFFHSFELDFIVIVQLRLLQNFLWIQNWIYFSSGNYLKIN